MKYIFTVVSVFMICMSSAYAVDLNIIGNGGNVIACQNNKIIPLDLYEAEMIFGFKPAVFDSKENYISLAKQIISANSFFKPQFEKKLLQWIDQFEVESRFITGVELAKTEDSYHLAIPKNCTLEQMVIQREPQFSVERRYTINKDIWEKLDSVYKAAVLTHEVVYRLMIDNYGTGQYLNSIPVRYFVGYAFSKKINTLSVKEKTELETSLGLGNLPEWASDDYISKHLWAGESVDKYPELDISYSFKFKDPSTIYYVTECRFSDGGKIKIEANLNVTMGDRVITVNKAESKVVNNNGKYCAFTIEKGSFMYAFTDDGNAVIFRGNIYKKQD